MCLKIILAVLVTGIGKVICVVMSKAVDIAAEYVRVPLRVSNRYINRYSDRQAIGIVAGIVIGIAVECVNVPLWVQRDVGGQSILDGPPDRRGVHLHKS